MSASRKIIPILNFEIHRQNTNKVPLNLQVKKGFLKENIQSIILIIAGIVRILIENIEKKGQDQEVREKDAGPDQGTERDGHVPETTKRGLILGTKIKRKSIKIDTNLQGFRVQKKKLIIV